MSDATYVLCIGHRLGLAKALAKKGISFSVLSNKPLKKTPKGCDQVIVDSFENALLKAEELKEKLTTHPTHIIAATESGVFPASLLRKYFGSRFAEHSIVRRCTNKMAMKNYLDKHDIPMTNFIIDRGNLKAERILDQLGLPLVVKDPNQSGGRGVHICNSKDELDRHKGIDKIYESYVDAPEGSVESFVSNHKILFTNITDYYVKTKCNVLPANYQQDELNEILKLNEDVIQKLNIEWGMTHLEFYRHPSGLLFGEIAIRPPGGYIMELQKLSYGFNAWEAYLAIQLGEDFEFPTKNKAFSAAVIHHPGAGVVKSINHLEGLSSLKKHKIQVNVGEQIKERVGVGQQAGYSLLANSDHELLRKDIDYIFSSSIIELK